MQVKFPFLIYKARDNSGFVVYNKFSGETSFFITEQELLTTLLITEDELFALTI